MRGGRIATETDSGVIRQGGEPGLMRGWRSEPPGSEGPGRISAQSRHPRVPEKAETGHIGSRPPEKVRSHLCLGLIKISHRLILEYVAC